MIARALLLDRTHRVLLHEGALPQVRVPEGARPLAALARWIDARYGVDLPEPSGARPLDAPPVDFVFVIDGAAVRGEARWVSLAEAPDDAWRLYVDAMLGGWEPPSRALDVFAFGGDPAANARLAHLVVKGTKRATTGWIAADQKRKLTIPSPGLVSIVTDGFGVPLCCIETERVDRVRFGDVPADVAMCEGEGDRSLEDWREAHRRFFAREGDLLDLAFDDDAILYVEHFRLLKVLARG